MMNINKVHLILGILFLSDLINGIIENQISILIISAILIALQIVFNIRIAKFNKLESVTYFLLICYNFHQIFHYGTDSIWFLFCFFEIYQMEKKQFKRYRKMLQVIVGIILFSMQYQGNFVYSQFQTIIQCIAVLCYQLSKMTGQFSIVQTAENEILQDLKQQIIIKIFDSTYKDITPKNIPQLEINSQYQLTQNTQVDENYHFYIKCQQIQEFTDNLDQNSNKQLIFQDCISLMEFINGQDQQQCYRYVASQVDLKKNIKDKFRIIHKKINKGNLTILAFQKIDNFEMIQTKKKIYQFKKQFSDLFAHKLRTPLNATLGFLSQANNSNEVDNVTKNNFIRPAYVNSKLQYFQIADLLYYLSPQTDQQQFQPSKINMKQFLFSLQELIESQCINKRILFQVFVQHVPLQVIENFYLISDILKLERVLYNILNQSYRHTPSNGSISLNVNVNAENTEISFAIEGSGCGFNEEDIENINQWLKPQSEFLFKKKQIVIKKELKLSLEITNNLINILSQQEQNLEVVQSELGTEFRFKIPNKEFKVMEVQQELQSVGYVLKQRSLRNMKSSQNNQATSKSMFSSQEQNLQINSQTNLDEPQPNQPLINRVTFFKVQRKQNQMKRPRSSLFNKVLIDVNKSILIVDDEPFNHDTLILMLKSMGFKKFLKAFNGQQAIDIIKENEENISVILMDLDMPIMGGIDATKILIQMMIDLVLVYIPIMGCTAHDDKETLEKCIEVGMLHVILKPVFVKTLKEAFHYIINNEDVKKRSFNFQNSQLQI